MRRWAAVVVAVAVVLGSQPVWARTRFHDAAESTRYGTKAGGMLGRGLLNVVTSPVDVVVNVVNETKAGPPFVGTMTGIGKGVGCGVLRLGSGALDVVTFWVPGFNGAPVSDSYENCLAERGMMASSAAPAVASESPAASWDAAPEALGTVQATEPEPRVRKTYKK